MTEIERRRLLRVGAVALGAGLAGCSGGGGGDDGDDSGDNESQDDSEGQTNGDDGGEQANGENGGNEQARQEFDAAVETLQVVEAGLSAYRDVEEDPTGAPDGGVQSQEVETLRSRVDEAESTLSGIDASGDLSTQVSIAVDVAAFQRTLVDALVHWRDRNQAFEAAAVAQGSGEYETAAAEYGAAADALEGYRTLLDDIESAHAAIDSGAFEPEGIRYGEAVWTYLRVGSRGEIDARQTFLAGEQDRVTGVGAFRTAEQAWDSEQWTDARAGYEASGSAFETARNSFESVVNNGETPALVEESANGRVEEMATLVDVTSLLADAAEAAAAGNQAEAEDLRQQAREQLA